MRFETINPSRELSKYVRHYWTLESTPNDTYLHRIIPNGLTELIFYLSERPVSLDSKRELSDNILINGQSDSFFDIGISKKLSLFSVYFLPHGLSMFLDLPMKEVLNRSIPLQLWFKDHIVQLEDEMLNARSIAEKAAIVERFLLQRLHSGKMYEYNRLDHCLNLINRSRGKITIKELASEACLGRRQLERTFSTFIGLSPKKFLRIVRFQNAIQSRLQCSETSFTDIYTTCGYYDQAHMIEDFQSFTGWSPKKYFDQGSPYSDYFQ